MIDVTVKIPSMRNATIIGRNGEFDLTAIQVWGDRIAFIDGIGKRGIAIRGGFNIPKGVMDELCLRWLLARLDDRG